MLPVFAVLFGATAAFNLTCHCLNGTLCHANGFCEQGCEKGWFGTGCQIGDVKFFGVAANQSSTFNDTGYTPPYVYSAGLALDGMLPIVNDGNQARFCSHTAPLNENGGSAWWYVVLNTTHNVVVSHITISNRKDSPSAKRLANFVILYSNETESEPHPNSSMWHVCARQVATFTGKMTYTCTSTAIGKRVAVYLTATTPDNPKAILTLCEVEIYGFLQYGCQSGFTGPGCLLRACEDCASPGRRCSTYYGGVQYCSYDICPDRSLKPPECWITLSNYSEVDIQSTPTCNNLLISVELPYENPNLAASQLQLQVYTTADKQVVVNKTLPVQRNKSIAFNYSDATANTSYELSVKPMYCNSTNTPCFYGTSSRSFTAVTGTRKYLISHNNTCVFINVSSETLQCELPTVIKANCTSETVGVSTNYSSSTVCGLERGQGYNCSIAATINSNTTEIYNESIKTEPLPLSTSSPAIADNTVLVAGVGSAAAAVVIILVIIVVIYYRRRQNAKSKASTVHAHAVAYAPSQAPDITRLPSAGSAKPLAEDDEQTYCNMSGMTLPQFQEYAKNEALIARRFTELQTNELHPCTEAKSLENKGKNRFQNILPYDSNRVRLRSAANGYINASYINGFSKSKEYIASQGPSPKTVEDFWHMLWQEGCSVIIMLTDYIENAKKKCEKYFPFTKSHGMSIEVTVRATTVFDTHTITVLNVQQGSEKRIVHHFHFLAWPDQSVPSHPAEMLLFYSRICQHLKRQPSKSPLIVHCSAGVGRTGAYIAFDYLMQRFKSDITIDVDSCVVKLRDQRMLMVQTKEQYVFLHRMVMYGLETSRYIYDAAQLPVLARNGSSSHVDLAAEWQKLQELAPTFHEQSYSAALLPENNLKNRCSDILALESKRPMLSRSDGGDQLYINAVYCNGCYANRAFLATQLPLPGTVNDFWLMVYDCQPSCVILLHPLPAEDEDCPRYWPEPGHSITTGWLEVTCNLGSKDDSGSSMGMPCFDVSLSPVSGRMSGNQTVSTKLFSTSLWNTSSAELPGNAREILVAASAVRSYFVEGPQKQIVVQCRDGVTQCGLFLALVNALHRLIETGQLSVFHTLHLLRTSRPEFVTTEAQYRFIYQILDTYHESSSIYANA